MQCSDEQADETSEQTQQHMGLRMKMPMAATIMPHSHGCTGWPPMLWLSVALLVGVGRVVRGVGCEGEAGERGESGGGHVC